MPLKYQNVALFTWPICQMHYVSMCRLNPDGGSMSGFFECYGSEIKGSLSDGQLAWITKNERWPEKIVLFGNVLIWSSTADLCIMDNQSSHLGSLIGMQASSWRRSFVTYPVVSSCIDISLFVSIDIHTPTLSINKECCRLSYYSRHISLPFHHQISLIACTVESHW